MGGRFASWLNCFRLQKRNLQPRRQFEVDALRGYLPEKPTPQRKRAAHEVAALELYSFFTTQI